MFSKKGFFFLIAAILMLFGCDSSSSQVLFGDIVLTANGKVASDFLPSRQIEVKASISKDILAQNHAIYWKEDEGEYVQSSDTVKTFGPYTDKSRHTVSVKVVFGVNEKLKSLDLNIGSPLGWNGKLSVSGTNIVNEDGKAIQLRGMSTHGLQYFNSFYNETAIKSLAEDWHADIVRISSYVNEGGWSDGGNYLDQPDFWRARIDSMVSWAEQNGIYALIDWHQLTPGDPNYFINEAKEFFTYMVDKHGDKPNVLFDICNEPNSDSTYVEISEDNWVSVSHKRAINWERIKEYADQIIPIIRAKSDNIIIVGTPQWASRPDLVSNNMINEKNIMYTMHFYAAEHKGYINYVKNAINAGVPVFVTEFGTQMASGDLGNNFEESQKWIDFLSENKVSWCNWNFSNDFRTGAVFKKWYKPTKLEDYSNHNNLKEAGIWIMNAMNTPADDF